MHLCIPWPTMSVKTPGYASEVTPVILESVVPILAASAPPESLQDVQMLQLCHKPPESDALGLVCSSLGEAAHQAIPSHRKVREPLPADSGD